MKRSFSYQFIFILICTSIIYSCSEKQEYPNNDIKFDTISVVRTYHLENDSTQPSCNLKVDFIYPINYSDKKVLTTIQKEFITTYFESNYTNETPAEVLEKYADSYKNNYLDDAKIFGQEKDHHEDPDHYFSYYEAISNSITFNKANILSFQIIQSNYKGGTSSYKIYRNYVIDLKTGKIISIEDIFHEGYEQPLNEIIKDKLLSKNKVKTIKELEELGYFGIDEIIPNGNFSVNEQGINFTFNKGEYSVLQLDEINIFFVYDELKPLLAENSPISIFFK